MPNFHGCLHSRGFSLTSQRVLAVRTTTVQRYVFKDSQSAGRLLPRQRIAKVVEALVDEVLPLSVLMEHSNLLHELRVGDGIILSAEIQNHIGGGCCLLTNADWFFLINGG